MKMNIRLTDRVLKHIHGTFRPQRKVNKGGVAVYAGHPSVFPGLIRVQKSHRTSGNGRPPRSGVSFARFDLLLRTLRLDTPHVLAGVVPAKRIQAVSPVLNRAQASQRKLTMLPAVFTRF